MTATSTAKIFMNGRSQAVRLPKEFRFDTSVVTVERMGDAVVLRPHKQTKEEWWAEMEQIFDAFEGMPDHIERDQTPAREVPDFD